MVIPAFSVGRLPSIRFGAGERARIGEIAGSLGKRILLVTGARSFRASPHASGILQDLRARGVAWESTTIEGEPSPGRVDEEVARRRGDRIEAVVAIGGGSVLDAAKAIAALLPSGRSVMDHLEEVGRGLPFDGPALPWIAVPTTAGTGSEATRNAVLSARGPAGSKRSFRDEALVARWAVVDPDLLESCPRELIAAGGMDALTQLLEAYVSTRATPFTDTLAESGLGAVRDGLLPWYEGTGDPRAARSRMAWAALASGIALAYAGLGAVHGLSSPLGAFFPVPHGVACGTLASAVVIANVTALRERQPRNPAIARDARAASILSGSEASGSFPAGPDTLVQILEEWTERLCLPRLGAYGVTEEDVPAIVGASRAGSMKTNPIVLTDEELGSVLRSRL